MEHSDMAFVLHQKSQNLGVGVYSYSAYPLVASFVAGYKVSEALEAFVKAFHQWEDVASFHHFVVAFYVPIEVVQDHPCYFSLGLSSSYISQNFRRSLILFVQPFMKSGLLR